MENFFRVYKLIFSLKKVFISIGNYYILILNNYKNKILYFYKYKEL